MLIATTNITNSPTENITSEQITTFADDNPDVSGAKLMSTSSGAWKSFAEESRQHNIIDILSRPVLLTNSKSVWSTSKSANSFPTENAINSSFSFPSAIFENSPNIVNKISNFAFLRADVKVRVMVNAQAFSQGKLWIWFSPYELSSGTSTAADNLHCKTGYPGVELDVAAGVPVEFSIPYCAPQSHYSLTTGEGTMGDLFLTVLSPLTVTDASISVFAWFENIDLQLPTGAKLTTPTSISNYYTNSGVCEVTAIGANHPAWGSLVPFDSVLFLKKPLMVFSRTNNTINGNMIIFPVGTKLTLSSEVFQTTSRLLLVADSTGLTGIIPGNLSTFGSLTFNFAVSSGNVCIDSPNHYSSLYPAYFVLTPGATYANNACIQPNTIITPVPSRFVAMKDFVTISKLPPAIVISPPNVINTIIDNTNSLMTTVDNNVNTFIPVGLSSATLAGLSWGFDLGFGSNYYNSFAQSDDKIQDDWYTKYPRAQMDESEIQATTGLVTSALKTLGYASKVPLLSSLVAPISWISRLGSLSSSGFSKPIDVEKPQCIYNVPAKGFTHGEGPDNSVSLSLIPDNNIGVVPNAFSTSIDELDISYISKKSCYLRTDPWTTTSTSKIYSIFVAPGISKYTDVFYEPTMLGFVSSMFKFWHGGIRYRISVAKTGFHSGRLRISYHPGAHILDTFYPADSAYSWILDLSISSEIDIEIPYVSTKPWLVSDLFDQNLSNPYGPAIGPFQVGANNLNFSTGILQVEVLNVLRVAGAASNTVDILTWISGSDNIEFSAPMFTSFRPCSQLTAPVVNTIRKKRSVSEIDEVEIPEIETESEICDEEIIPEAQGFQDISEASANQSQLSGEAFTKMFNSDSAFGSSHLLSIGEKITNLRTLIKRFVPIAYSTTFSNKIVFDPSYFGRLDSSSSTSNVPIVVKDTLNNVLGSYTNNQSPLEYISKIYRFYRGGRRYKAVIGNTPLNLTTYPFMLRAILDSVIQINGQVSSPQFLKQILNPEESFATAGRFSHFVDTTNNKICEVSTPFYSLTPIQVVSDGTTLDQQDDYISRNLLTFDFGASSTATGRTITFYGAANDDFNFGYLIGAPRLKRVELVVDFV